jgi:hypothetical protein
LCPTFVFIDQLVGILLLYLILQNLIKYVYMELKDFIKNTLVEIATGVEEAQKELKKHRGAIVNPRIISVETVAAKLPWHESNKQDVKFNVAVTATDEANAGAGIHVANLFKAGGDIKEINSSVSTISFYVPMILPMD